MIPQHPLSLIFKISAFKTTIANILDGTSCCKYKHHHLDEKPTEVILSLQVRASIVLKVAALRSVSRTSDKKTLVLLDRPNSYFSTPAIKVAY